MKILAALGLLLFSTLNASSGLAHGATSRVEIELESAATISAGQNDLTFQLIDEKLKTIVADQDLAITHEKKLHVIIYDESLNEFTHVHPDFTGGAWRVTINLAVDGKYFVWAQGELAADGTEFSALVEIQVTKGRQAWPLPPVLKDQRVGVVDNSRVTLSKNVLKAGKMAMLDLKFDRADGSAAMITPYLGAMAHVVATPADGDSLVHVHPMGGASPSQGMLHVTFPTSGAYRVWVQFVDAGILRVVPLALEVQ